MNRQGFSILSDLDFLPLAASSISPIAPTAFVFHVSRCGSTLVSQLLSKLPQNIVLSEPPLLDKLLRLRLNDQTISVEQQKTYIQSALSLLGQQRFEGEKNLIIKLDSWHVFFSELLRELYPTAAFLYLIRRPDEVIRSHQKQRGMQAVPGLLEPELFGLQSSDLQNHTLDSYLEHVLTLLYQKVLFDVQQFPDTLLLDYAEDPLPLFHRITQFLGIDVSEMALAQIEARTAYHAKHPQQVFEQEKTSNDTASQQLRYCYQALQQLK